MASDSYFIEYVVEQISPAGDIVCKKMFGEYGLYCDGKFFGMVCDDKFFIKPTQAGRTYIGEPTEAPAYPGAKNSFLIEEQLDDSKWLCGLVQCTVAELPVPKPKKKKK
ncbi:TfoX/Sxy family protein [Gilvibacter sediminis]|uniref:TfoX/Sxy family protein n=1 Tax=Gilvibacter sediminis TaxID=379071 RepID=UPI002350F257|nr:TfoX/Sxy family protein [Gilvibacter sediminis]MDC7996945.1 TfoX/Sxy family protein [Gilvibacter sediminis]